MTSASQRPIAVETLYAVQSRAALELLRPSDHLLHSGIRKQLRELGD